MMGATVGYKLAEVGEHMQIIPSGSIGAAISILASNNSVLSFGVEVLGRP